MAGLALNGPLNLAGVKLELKTSGGATVTANGTEVLVERSAPLSPNHGTAPPVILPPPPLPPPDTGPNVWVINAFNKAVTVNGRPIVALGMAMQGNLPSWPGMVQPSTKNSGQKAVTINNVPANVVNDRAVIFPTGAPVTLATSGQGA